jgi:putative membrane protein
LSTTDTKEWRHTSPLAVVFFLGQIYQTIAQNAVQSLAPLVAVMFAYKGDLLWKIVFGTVAFFVITIAISVVRYWFFRYQITDDSILIREGVIKKTQLDIKFDRIQAISTKQNILDRAFDLVTVKIDTAGSSKQEGHLPAIKTEQASALKERIRREKPVTRIAKGAEDAGEEIATETPILNLSSRDMVKIGLSSNRALIFLALLGPIIEQVDQDIEESIDGETLDTAIDVAQQGVQNGIEIGLLIVVGFLLLLVVASVVGAFLRYHKFRLVTDRQTFRSTGGLVTRHEHSVSFAKIQSVLASQNPVLRLFGRFRLTAKKASSGKQSRGKHFVVPLCDSQQLRLVAGAVFGSEFEQVDLRPTADAFEPISRHYVRSRILLLGVLPALLVTGLMSFVIGYYAALFLIWIALITPGVWIKYKKYGYVVAKDGMVLRRGFVGFNVSAFLHRKVQRVSVTQTFLQKRKSLATMRFYLASGSLKLRYVDYGMASKLRDYVLYRVESSQLAWH